MNDWFEKIEDYISGKMGSEEKRRFEAELSANEELAATFHLYQYIDDEMRSAEKWKEQDAALEASLHQLNQEYFTGETKEAVTDKTTTEGIKVIPLGRNGQVKKITSWKRVAVAAACLGIVSLAVFVYRLQSEADKPAIAVRSTQNPDKETTTSRPDTTTRQNVTQAETATSGNETVPVNNEVQKKGKPQPQRIISQQERNTLFAQHFHPDTATVPTTADSRLQDALDYFRENEYEGAIAAIDRIDWEAPSRGKTDKEVSAFYRHYLKAMSYLSLDDAAKAIAELNKAQVSDPALHSKKQWYLALAYLKNGDADEAEKLLVRLSQNADADEYRKQAKSLLTGIKRKQ